ACSPAWSGRESNRVVHRACSSFPSLAFGSWLTVNGSLPAATRGRDWQENCERPYLTRLFARKGRLSPSYRWSEQLTSKPQRARSGTKATEVATTATCRDSRSRSRKAATEVATTAIESQGIRARACRADTKVWLWVSTTG